MAQLARAADRRISGAQPGVPQLCQAGRPGEPAADRRPTGRSSPARATRAFRRSSPCFVRAVTSDTQQPQGAKADAARSSLHAGARRGGKAIPVRFGHQARRRPRQGNDRGAERRPGASRPAARRCDGAAALAAARAAQDADRRQHRRIVPRLLARRPARRPPQGRSTAKPDKPTPQLQSPIFRLVAKPTWTVPKGIGEKELATKGQAGCATTISS